MCSSWGAPAFDEPAENVRREGRNTDGDLT
jgi:hypothetical protein